MIIFLSRPGKHPPVMKHEYLYHIEKKSSIARRSEDTKCPQQHRAYIYRTEKTNIYSTSF